MAAVIALTHLRLCMWPHRRCTTRLLAPFITHRPFTMRPPRWCTTAGIALSATTAMVGVSTADMTVTGIVKQLAGPLRVRLEGPFIQMGRQAARPVRQGVP